jgi:hypothetical protein
MSTLSNLRNTIDSTFDKFIYIIIACGYCFIYMIIKPFNKPIKNNTMYNTPSTSSNNYFETLPIVEKLIYFFWSIVIWSFIMSSYFLNNQIANSR